MSVENDIWDIAHDPLTEMGYNLVRVKIYNKRPRILQIMAERQDLTAMTVDDCADISRLLSALLDVEDPIKGSYNLEVSSPGIARPLVQLGDFSRFSDYIVKMDLKTPVEQGRKITGRLKGVDENQGDAMISILLGEGTKTEELTMIAFSNIQAAELVVNDELIRGALKKQA